MDWRRSRWTEATGNVLVLVACTLTAELFLLQVLYLISAINDFFVKSVMLLKCQWKDLNERRWICMDSNRCFSSFKRETNVQILRIWLNI